MRRGELMGMSVLVWVVFVAASTARGETTDTSHGVVDRTRVHVVTRDAVIGTPADRPQVRRVALTPHHQREGSVEIVYRRVVEPAATVSRALSEQPVHPHLIKVLVGSTSITLDPYQELRRPTGGIDENHFLRRAQRHWRDRQARPAQVIRRPAHLCECEPDEREAIQPRAIIPVPPEHRRPDAPSVVRRE